MPIFVFSFLSLTIKTDNLELSYLSLVLGLLIVLHKPDSFLQRAGSVRASGFHGAGLLAG